MRKLIRKTITFLLVSCLILLMIVITGIAIFAHYKGGVEGYRLGKARAEMDDQFKAYVERGEPFVWDKNIVYPARRVIGKKSPYYIINAENK